MQHSKLAMQPLKCAALCVLLFVLAPLAWHGCIPNTTAAAFIIASCHTVGHTNSDKPAVAVLVTVGGEITRNRYVRQYVRHHKATYHVIHKYIHNVLAVGVGMRHFEVATVWLRSACVCRLS